MEISQNSSWPQSKCRPNPNAGARDGASDVDLELVVTFSQRSVFNLLTQYIVILHTTVVYVFILYLFLCIYYIYKSEFMHHPLQRQRNGIRTVHEKCINTTRYLAEIEFYIENFITGNQFWHSYGST